MLLPAVGQAEQADVGEHPQFEAQVAFFAAFARRALPRRPIGARFEVDVAEAAASALGDQHLLAVVIEIGDDALRILVGDHCADRDMQGDVLAAGAVTVAGGAVLAALGEEFPCVAKLDQRIEVAVGDDIDAAAATAVAAVRSALGLVLLAPERNDAVAAVAGSYVNFGFIDEFHRLRSISKGLTKMKKPYRKDRASVRQSGCRGRALRLPGRC